VTQRAATLVWVGGEVVPSDRAVLPALDRGFTVGDGVFETLKVVDGRPFALERHQRRLVRSADAIGLVGPSSSVIRDVVEELLAQAGPMPLGRLRITLTAGGGPLGSGRSPVAPTLMVAVEAAAPWPDRIAVLTVPWTRNERSATAGVKTTSYAENVVCLRQAQSRGAHEALLANTQGMLCEGTGSNVLVERDGVLVTPPLASGCLAGITRELFLEWAAADGLPVVEADLPMAELTQASSMLLTSSTRDVQLVHELDGRELEPSPVGKAAVELFARRAAERVDP
jgi:branched-chain amino acid aminotransferase